MPLGQGHKDSPAGVKHADTTVRKGAEQSAAPTSRCCCLPPWRRRLGLPLGKRRLLLLLCDVAHPHLLLLLCCFRWRCCCCRLLLLLTALLLLGAGWQDAQPPGQAPAVGCRRLEGVLKHPIVLHIQLLREQKGWVGWGRK